MNQCPDCGKSIFYFFSHETICKNCGFVLDDELIDKKLSYTKSSSIISSSNHKVEGKVIKNHWFYSKYDKNIYNIKLKIEKICSNLEIPDIVVRESILIYEHAIKKQYTQCRDNTDILLASIYLGCLIHQIPRTPQEIANFGELKVNKLLKKYVLLKKELNLAKKSFNSLDFINRFGSQLNLKQKTITRAYTIFNKINKNNLLQGKNPITVIATALYISIKLNKEKISQTAIANVTGVIEQTVRERSRKLFNSGIL